MCVFWPSAKGFPDLSSGHGCLVFPLQPGSLPGGDRAARWVIHKWPMVNVHAHSKKLFNGIDGFDLAYFIIMGFCFFVFVFLQFPRFVTPPPWHLIVVLFSAPQCSDDKVQPSYLTSLKMLLCHIPYQRLVLGFVFSVLAFQVQFELVAFHNT